MAFSKRKISSCKRCKVPVFPRWRAKAAAQALWMLFTQFSSSTWNFKIHMYVITSYLSIKKTNILFDKLVLWNFCRRLSELFFTHIIVLFTIRSTFYSYRCTTSIQILCCIPKMLNFFNRKALHYWRHLYAIIKYFLLSLHGRIRRLCDVLQNADIKLSFRSKLSRMSCKSLERHMLFIENNFARDPLQIQVCRNKVWKSSITLNTIWMNSKLIEVGITWLE